MTVQTDPRLARLAVDSIRFLAADAVTNPNVSRSFARFVVRCERTIYRRLLETGRSL